MRRSWARRRAPVPRLRQHARSASRRSDRLLAPLLGSRDVGGSMPARWLRTTCRAWWARRNAARTRPRPCSNARAVARGGTGASPRSPGTRRAARRPAGARVGLRRGDGPCAPGLRGWRLRVALARRMLELGRPLAGDPLGRRPAHDGRPRAHPPVSGCRRVRLAPSTRAGTAVAAGAWRAAATAPRAVATTGARTLQPDGRG